MHCDNTRPCMAINIRGQYFVYAVQLASCNNECCTTHFMQQRMLLLDKDYYDHVVIPVEAETSFYLLRLFSA